MTEWKLSDRGVEIVSSLQGGSNRLDLIEELGDEPTIVLTHLVDYLVPPRVPEAEGAAGAVARVLSRTPVSSLRTVDIRVRHGGRRWWSGGAYRSRWHGLSPSDARKLVRRTAEPLAVAAMCSMHPNGHVREEAVRLLARTGEDNALPYLLIRTIDWVDQVAAAARSAFFELAHDADPDALVNCYGLIDGDGFDRDGGAQVRQEFDSLVSTRELLTASAVLGLSDRMARRSAARRLSEVDAAEAVKLLGDARGLDDVVLATTVAARAIVDADSESVESLLGLLIGHPVGRLRQMGYWELAKRFPDRAVTTFERALFDRARGVRDLAQRELQRRDVEVVGKYRDALPSQPRVALLGLGEVGTEAEVAVALARLDDPDPGVRSAAVRAVALLAGNEHTEAVLIALRDPAPQVSREALRGLLRRASLLGADDLWPLIIYSQSPRVRRNALRLAMWSSKWARLLIALRCMASGNPDLQDSGEDLLDRALAQMGSSPARPNSSQADEVEQLVSQLSDQLTAFDAGAIRHSLSRA